MCTKPAFAAQQVAPGCPSTTSRYFRVGDVIASSPLFQQTTTGCRPTTPSGTSAYYGLGDQVAPAPLTRGHDSEPGRTPQLIHFSDGATRLRDSLLYDSAHATECRETRLDDGSIRCLPDAGSVQTFYSDAGCTQTVDVVAVNAGPASCGAPKVPAFAIKSVPLPAGACGSSAEVYATGAAYTGALFQGPSGCASADTTGLVLYQLGALHPLSEFPQATLVTDP